MTYADTERQLANDIKTRGYWEFVVRPLGYEKRRVTSPDLLIPLVQKAHVERGGWSLPVVDGPDIHLDHEWIGQSTEWQHQREVWRMFTSGQFYWLGGIPWEWRDRSTYWPPSSTPGWKPNEILLVPAAIVALTMMVEFATRLAQAGAIGEQMQLQAVLGRTTKRSLISDEWFMREGRTADVDHVSVVVDVAQKDLLARSDEIALDLGSRIFRMFRWAPSREVLVGIQQNVRRS
jgi:hypothetical protein